MSETIPIERLPVRLVPSFDCIYDNATCPSCRRLRELGKHTANHGISGGRYFFAVQACQRHRNGIRIVVAVLEVLAREYPKTVPVSHFGARGLGSASAGTLSIHLAPSSSGNQGDGIPCEWTPSGRCVGDSVWYGLADEIWRDAGAPDASPLSAQPDVLWERIASHLLAHMEKLP